MTRQGVAFVGLTAVVSFLLGLVVAGTRPPLPTNVLPLPPVSEQLQPLAIASSGDAGNGDATTTGGVDFGTVAARLNAAVVNVDAASRGSDDRPRTSRRFARDDANAPREGSGSGFIIDARGFLLTNHHVVSGADRVTVTLSDGRIFKADVIGLDPVIDVALLQVHARDPLPVAPLGSSDALRVGEWVCAIGNPLGVYVHSVTVGVVSFLGRKLFDQGLDAYIQTDAAISFGNSGGPLINTHGQVVGITTAISSQNPNIGFAIPISQVISVLPQLREHGSVARGYIAMGLTTVTPELRRGLRLEPEHGALVEDVPQDTPAARAGLRPYDVVVRVDGRTIGSDEELTRYISTRPPGTLAALDVWRDGDTRTFYVKLRERPLPEAISRRTPRDDVRPAFQAQTPLGMKVRDLDAGTADRLNIPGTIQGVLVTDIDPAGPARLAQIKPNHVVLEINRHRVTTTQEYLTAVNGLKRGEIAALLIYDRSARPMDGVQGQRVISVVIPDSEQ